MWAAKKAASIVFGVSSQAVALAPFSQYSKVCGLFGLAQAQLTHMNPFALFCRISSAPEVSKVCSRARISATDFSEPRPPAGPA